MSTTPRISIRADHAGLALTCAGGEDEVRLHLCALRVEPRAEGGVFIIGTDGHTLMLIEDEAAICTEPAMLILGDELVAQLPLMARGEFQNFQSNTRLVLDHGDKPALHLVNAEGCVIYTQQGETTMPAQREDGRPWYDWRKVMPDFAALRLGLVDPFQPGYMDRVLTAFMGCPQMLPAQVASEGVIAVQFQHHTEALLLVMPQWKVEWVEQERPGWLAHWSAVKGAQAAQQPATEAAA